MRCPWTVKSIEWYREAEGFTSYYRRIMDLTGRYLDRDGSALDVGCGIGSLTMELAMKCSGVEAIDKSGLAVTAVGKRMKELGLSNIQPRNVSFEELSLGRRYHAVYLSYVMGLVQGWSLKKILEHSSRYVFIVIPARGIKNDFNVLSLAGRMGMDTGTLRQPCHKDIIPIMGALGVDYCVDVFESEFGQPFCSREEAMDFFKHYYPDFAARNGELNQWLSENLEYRDGRHYLPSSRESALITIVK